MDTKYWSLYFQPNRDDVKAATYVFTSIEATAQKAKELAEKDGCQYCPLCYLKMTGRWNYGGRGYIDIRPYTLGKPIGDFYMDKDFFD